MAFNFFKTKTKVSVITWDASFRESFHTVDCFAKQDYPRDSYEFIYVDFYQNSNPVLLEKISTYSNARLLNLNHDKGAKWHLGKCINAGIKEARGEVLIIPDGDIVASPQIVSTIVKEHRRYDDAVVYFRRWDEPSDKHDPKRSYHLDYLEQVCQLTNATNYGGLISLRKETLGMVNFYEESDVFSGPGANGLELYLRLRNRALPIKWHHEKIYHPFHHNTGTSLTDREYMEQLARRYPWINPYSGIEQSWVLTTRNLDLNYRANEGYIEETLRRLPKLEL